MSHEGQSPPEQTVLDSTEILAVINADPRLTRTQVLERKINRGFIRSKKHEEMECFVYHVLAQDVSYPLLPLPHKI